VHCLLEMEVTLSELQTVAAQMRSPPGTVFLSRRFQEILERLHQYGAVADLPELAERCASMPELLDPETCGGPDRGWGNQEDGTPYVRCHGSGMERSAQVALKLQDYWCYFHYKVVFQQPLKVPLH